MATVIIEKLTEEEIARRGIRSWPVWEKEASRFSWTYDAEEQCLILEGDVVIETTDDNFSLKPGDFVTFEIGLECVWDIRSAVKKHYHFS
ncbi:MAG: cupin [bacterium]|nr:MAG: cupin [bacterium]